jgi:hypothetical protein
MSVVIVCCAVGHAATNARPLMSRPVPRRTRAGSGRRAPGRPSRYPTTCPRQDEDAAPDRAPRPGNTRCWTRALPAPARAPQPGEVLECAATHTASPGGGHAGRSAPRQVSGADGSLDVHHRGVQANRDVVQKHLAVDRPDIDPYLVAVLDRGELTCGVSDVCPAVLAKWLRVPQGTTIRKRRARRPPSRRHSRSVSSGGDEHLSALVHRVPSERVRPVTRTHLTDIDLPGRSGSTDGGLVHA